MMFLKELWFILNTIDTSDFVLKAQYDTDQSVLEKDINNTDKKMLDTSELVKKTDHWKQVVQRWLRLKTKYLVLLA